MRYILLVFVIVQGFSSCAQKSQIVILMERFYGEIDLPSKVEGLEYSIKTWDEKYDEHYKYVKVDDINNLQGLLYRHSTVESDMIEIKDEKVKYYINNNEVSGIDGADNKDVRDDMRSKLQIYQTILFAPNYILENSQYFNFLKKETFHDLGELSVYECRRWPEHLKLSSSNDIKFYFSSEGQLVSIKEFKKDGQGVAMYMFGAKEYKGKMFPKMTSVFIIDKDGKRVSRIEQQEYAFGQNLIEKGTKIFR